MTGINNNFLSRQLQIKNNHLKEEKAPLQTEAGEKQLPTNAPAPTAESEAMLAQQANYMAMLNKPANGRDTENDVRNELESELEGLNNTTEEEPGVETDNTPAPPEMDEPEPIDFDESVIVRSETVESSGNASESGRMNAQSVTKTKTTTDYDSLDRPVRVTVVITKNGEVVETKVTVYQYDGDSKTPSRTETETKNGNDELVSRFNTDYREDGSVEKTYDYKYENGQIVDRTDTHYYTNGKECCITDYKYENGKVVGKFKTDYYFDGTLAWTTDYKYENGKEVGYFKTYYREDGKTIGMTQEYKYENGKVVGWTETYYREDGKTIDETREYKRHYYTATREDGSTYNAYIMVLTDHVEYAEDGKTPLKETKYEYGDDGNVTKSITKNYEYDDKGRVIKITTETKDAVNNTRSVDVEEFEYEEEDNGKIGGGGFFNDDKFGDIGTKFGDDDNIKGDFITGNIDFTDIVKVDRDFDIKIENDNLFVTNNNLFVENNKNKFI